ncbi:MAG: hypothetical protein JSW40_06690 [Candidatus Omnitrophota bacterium]|nr:MAG: hypothetical protein JSW40_06690 [Candidatus Omnitrophota bacterium]
MRIRSINTQRVLVPTQISLADFVINPYRGCEFGCLYCYSQENKNLQNKTFFTCLGVKTNAPRILERELKYVEPQRVLLGSTTECFQYQELKFHITAKILSILNSNNIAYTILTKSDLIGEYLSLIAQNRHNKIYFTLNLASDRIIQFLEPKAPLLGQRIKTIQAIASYGINLRVHIGPFIPSLSQLHEILRILPEGVKEIDVELYHQKQGNFEVLLNCVERNMDRETVRKIRKVYENENTYRKFAKTLEGQIKKYAKTDSAVRFYYIVPDFNAFYAHTLNYAQPLL